jgi:hypothetical protein
MEGLVAKLNAMSPELLAAKGVAHATEVPFEVHGHRFAIAHRQAA